MIDAAQPRFNEALTALDRELINQALAIAHGRTMMLGNSAHVVALVREIRRNSAEIRRLRKLLADREQLQPPEDREPGLEDVNF